MGGAIGMIKVMKFVMQTEIKVSLMTKTGNILITHISNRPIDGRSFYFLKIVLGKILEVAF